MFHSRLSGDCFTMQDSATQVDLDHLIERRQYELVITTIETVSQPNVNLEVHTETTSDGQRRSLLPRLVAGVALATIVGFCLWLLLKESPSSDEAKWAAATLSAVVAGLLGFWTGTLTRRAHR
jgi:hypothetical protein